MVPVNKRLKCINGKILHIHGKLLQAKISKMTANVTTYYKRTMALDDQWYIHGNSYIYIVVR